MDSDPTEEPLTVYSPEPTRPITRWVVFQSATQAIRLIGRAPQIRKHSTRHQLQTVFVTSTKYRAIEMHTLSVEYVWKGPHRGRQSSQWAKMDP